MDQKESLLTEFIEEKYRHVPEIPFITFVAKNFCTIQKLFPNSKLNERRHNKEIIEHIINKNNSNIKIITLKSFFNDFFELLKKLNKIPDSSVLSNKEDQILFCKDFLKNFAEKEFIEDESRIKLLLEAIDNNEIKKNEIIKMIFNFFSHSLETLYEMENSLNDYIMSFSNEEKAKLLFFEFKDDVDTQISIFNTLTAVKKEEKKNLIGLYRGNFTEESCRNYQNIIFNINNNIFTENTDLITEDQQKKLYFFVKAFNDLPYEIIKKFIDIFNYKINKKGRIVTDCNGNIVYISRNMILVLEILCRQYIILNLKYFNLIPDQNMLQQQTLPIEERKQQ
jgi:hypothetical protein